MCLLRDNGKAMIIQQDGLYEGWIINGDKNGKGRFITNYMEYEGQWLNDKKHGYGN